MCNRYVSPQEATIERMWHIGPRNNNPWRGGWVGPRGQGAFIRRSRHDPGYSLELVEGHWALIPWFAKEPKLKYSTNNARSEELAEKASFKLAWARGQRCIIPAESFDEPYWGPYEAQFKRCEWWTFRRADGQPWGLAGLWNVWKDPVTGQEVESYTMLTINADGHPIMGRVHKNEVDKETGEVLPLERQDKRSVISIELEDVDLWLQGTVDQARELLVPPSAQLFGRVPE
ncbi:SOS response-associated peptidase family protein [Leptospira sp. 96542]|nr:SOS response-associated peptidase family protein [Leptospira sp. 96542]